MTYYTVLVQEVWICPVFVEADNEQHAISKVVQDDDVEWDGDYYSHTLESDTWNVEECDNKESK